jgi:isoleucyl-tRNA synthetase
MYLEGSDQHRGWFQTSLIVASALRGAAPYKTVLTHGFVVDGEGKKMSKSIGNTVAPEKIIAQYGADILRLWVATSDYREDVRISQEILKGQIDSYRKIRNTVRFLLGNIYDYSPNESLKYEEMREIDKHCLGQLQETIKQVTNAYETYEFHRAAGAINNFCTVYLSGFYMDALKDTLYCEKTGSTARRSAQSAMWETCSVLARLLAPILSFTAEEVWQELRKKDATLLESVFLAEFPVVNEKYIVSEDSKALWEKLFALREKSLLKCEELRKEKKIGSNLEASLNIFDNGSLKGIDKELISSVIGTWDVAVSEVKDPGNKPGEVEVSAGVSKHLKCDRCWRHKDDVNPSSNLCKRCAEALV